MKSFSGIILLMIWANGLYAGSKIKNQQVIDTNKYQELDSMVVTAKAGLPPYQGSAPRNWEISKTRVALSFNWKQKTADVKEWINLHPYFTPTDTLALDAKSMKIDSIALVSKTGNKALDFTYANDKLIIRLGRMLSNNDSIQLYLKYQSMPYANETGGSAAITDDRGLYFINTDYSVPHKPAEIWTQGETESNSHWMITIDKPNTRFTTQVELTVPDSFTTLSNGAMVKQIKGTNGLRTDIWKMDMPIQAYAVMFAVGRYNIIKEKWKTKEVNYYVEPEFAPYAKMMFSNTPEMIGYFSECTGVPYPWNKYSQVVARDYVSGAMENTSASLFGEFMNQNAREIADKNSEDVVSHELFHQWFGDYVTCESWSNITVNESFANYGEQLWREHKYGKDYRDELAWDDVQKYIYASHIKDPQLVRFRYDNREEVFDAISYNKGGAILHYLNSLIGDKAFSQSMKLYLTKNALHSAEAHNWRMAVEEATGLDWNWFFNQWYYHGSHPELKIAYNYNDTTGQLGISVTQVQEDSSIVYKLPLKTAIIYGNQKTIIDWDINSRKDTFTYAYIGGLKPVIIPDYYHVLPGEIRENKKLAQWLTQFAGSDNYVSKKLAISGAGKQMADSNSQAIIDLALNSDMTAIRKNALLQLSNLVSDKYRKKWSAKVIDMATHDKEKTVRATAFDVISEWKLAAAKEIALSAINDSSYAIAGNALEALSKIDKDTAYVLAKKMINTQPRGNLKIATWTIIAQTGADNDIELFEHFAPYEQGSKKTPMAFSLNSYLKHVKSNSSYTRGVAVFADLIRYEDMKSRRNTLFGLLAQAASDKKPDLKSDDKEEAAIARQRFDIIKQAMQQLVAAETDTIVLEGYKKITKDTFED